MENGMKTFWSMILMVTILSLGGCATTSTITLTNDEISKIDSIRINPKVGVPETAFYHGAASNFSNGGLIGAAIAENDRPTDVILTELLTKNKIDIPEILATEFS